MLTKLTIQNFKVFEKVEIELGQNVVFIGPNNSGKTTALQALALWYTGLQKWLEEPPGGTINRIDLVAVPVPNAKLLWHNLITENGESNFIHIAVEWTANDSHRWGIGWRLKYANEESLYFFRDMQPSIPSDAVLGELRLAFLPPMSGLVPTEDRLERGSIQRRIGEGRTAEVLRNLCYQLYETNQHNGLWDQLVRQIQDLFRIELLPPEYLVSRGEIRMAYREQGVIFDLSAAGRGMLQILLLLSYLYTNPGAVLLLDEPDAHLEIIRQREVYNLLTRLAREQNSQIIAASHSEIVLEEAAEKDTAIAFLSQPHRIDKRNQSQVLKALKQIRAVDYYLAQQTGWVLYLEGATDLAILQTWAQRLQHPAADWLKRGFVYYLDLNKPSKAADHFQGLREAKPDLVAAALFDRIPAGRLQRIPALHELVWQRREIENYLCAPATLLNYAGSQADAERRVQVMQEVINLLVPRIALENPTDRWWLDTKASDDFLDRLFDLYFEKLGLPNLMRKTNYHILAGFVPVEQLDSEVGQKLDAIVEVARQARPRMA